MEPERERYAKRLDQEAQRLADLASSLRSEGLDEQAMSLETTIADLQWQCDELDSTELAAVGTDR